MPGAVEQTIKFGNEAFDTRGGAGKWVLAWGPCQAEALTKKELYLSHASGCSLCLPDTPGVTRGYSLNVDARYCGSEMSAFSTPVVHVTLYLQVGVALV
jgi:hypothetical protein